LHTFGCFSVPIFKDKQIIAIKSLAIIWKWNKKLTGKFGELFAAGRARNRKADEYSGFIVSQRCKDDSRKWKKRRKVCQFLG